MDLSSLMVTVLIAFLMLPSTSLAGSLPSKYGPRYVEEKSWVPWLTYEGVDSATTCASRCEEKFSESGWCNSFSMDNETLTCTLSNLNHHNTKGDTGPPVKVYTPLGRENVGGSVFLTRAGPDRATPTVANTHTKTVCSGGGDEVIPPFPAALYDSTGFSNHAVGFIADGAIVVVCGGKQLGSINHKKCHYYSIEDDAQASWDSTANMNEEHNNPGSVCTSNRMYILFGTGSGGTVEYFDGPSRAVKYLRDVNGDPVIHWDGIASNDITAPCAAAASDTEIIVTGYNEGFVTSRKTYSLNTETGTWTRLADMVAKRYLHSCGIVDVQGSQVMMAMGGLNRTQGLLEDQLHFEVLDLSTRSQWVLLGSTPNLAIRRGRIFNGGPDNRVTYVRDHQGGFLYQLNEATMSWETEALLDPEGLDTFLGSSEVIDQRYFPSCGMP